jgi:leader peptidase (prepilin peptidase)/N-methyltransferase
MSATFAVVVSGLLGACIGSFLNVVIWRVPRGQSVADGRSHCPKCGHLIRWFDNLPVLSWLALRARCRDCRAPISARYPFVEALTAALFVLLALRHPFPEATAVGAARALLLSALVVVSFVDVDRREIPDAITKPGIVVGLLLSLLLPALHAADVFPTLSNRHLAALVASACGVVAGAGVLLVVRWLGRLALGKEAMGLGDVKLLAMVGAFVGAGDVLLVLLVASVGGSVVGGAFVAGRGRRLAPLAGTLSLAGGAPAPFARARVRAPRRAPLTVAALVPAAATAGVAVGAPGALEVVLPATTVWSDDGKDVRVAVSGVVEAVDAHDGGTLVTLRPEPLAEADDAWLSTFALHRISIPFGVFLALGAAAVVVFGPEIRRFVLVTGPSFVTGR